MSKEKYDHEADQCEIILLGFASRTVGGSDAGFKVLFKFLLWNDLGPEDNELKGAFPPFELLIQWIEANVQ